MLHHENVDLEGYRRRFDTARCTGEFTPMYLPSFQTVERVGAVMRHDAPIIVLLRDPVERFGSAMRQRTLPAVARRWPWPLAQTYAFWVGMYADQLDVWTGALGRERFVILQYERVRDEPQLAVDRVWKTMGLDPVPLIHPERQSRTDTSRSRWEWPAGIRDHLVRLYRPQLARLVEYGIAPGALAVIRELATALIGMSRTAVGQGRPGAWPRQCHTDLR